MVTRTYCQGHRKRLKLACKRACIRFGALLCKPHAVSVKRLAVSGFNLKTQISLHSEFRSAQERYRWTALSALYTAMVRKGLVWDNVQIVKDARGDPTVQCSLCSYSGSAGHGSGVCLSCRSWPSSSQHSPAQHAHASATGAPLPSSTASCATAWMQAALLTWCMCSATCA